MPAAKKDELGIGGKIAVGVGITVVGVAGGVFVSNYLWTKYVTWRAQKAAKNTSAPAGAPANLQMMQGGVTTG